MVDDVDPALPPPPARRRSFVAGGPRLPAIPIGETLPELPVLTEIVDAELPTPVAEPVPEVVVPVIPAERVEALARAMLAELLPTRQQQAADAVGSWLDGELPKIVMRVLDGLTDHIVAQVTADVRASLVPALQTALEAETAAPEPAAPDQT